MYFVRPISFSYICLIVAIDLIARRALVSQRLYAFFRFRNLQRQLQHVDILRCVQLFEGA